jgi:hypothetical protein
LNRSKSYDIRIEVKTKGKVKKRRVGGNAAISPKSNLLPSSLDEVLSLKGVS